MKTFKDYVVENNIVTEDAKSAMNTPIYKKVQKYIQDELESCIYDFMDDHNANVIGSKFKEYNINWCDDEFDNDIEKKMKELSVTITNSLFRYYH